MTDRAEKLKQAGIKRHGSEEAWREALANQGKRGGSVKGESKKRGDTEYYKRIGLQGAMKKWHGKE